MPFVLCSFDLKWDPRIHVAIGSNFTETPLVWLDPETKGYKTFSNSRSSGKDFCLTGVAIKSSLQAGPTFDGSCDQSKFASGSNL